MSLLRRRGIAAAAAGEPAPGGFTPTDLSGLQGWWDASTLTLTAGDTVTQVDDLSGNAAHMTPPGTGPTFQIDSGRDSVYCKGSTGDIMAANLAAAVAQPFTRFVVCRLPDTGNDPISGRATLSSSTPVPLLRRGSGWYNGTFLSNSLVETTALYVGHANGASSYLRTNSVQVASGNSGTSGTEQLAWGGRGTYSIGLNPQKVYVHEDGIYDRELTVGELADLESYLTAKWSL